MSTINIYVTPPQREHKAVEECRRGKIRAYLPMVRFRTPHFGRPGAPIAHGYVFAQAKPSEAQHMRNRLGDVQRSEISRLYQHARVRPVKIAGSRFAIGDRVSIKVGPFASFHATITGTKGNKHTIAVSLFGKIHSVEMQEKHLRPFIDPG